MLAPYSETARSKLSDGSGTSSALASTSGKTMPDLLLAAARGRELRRRHVDADGPGAALREPGRDVCRAAAELDDVEAVDVAEAAERRLRTPKTPQVISSSAHFALARASVYSAFACVQSSRLRFASSEISGIGAAR